MLKSTLRRVLHVTQTGMGNVQVLEHGMLRLERHTGLSREFTDFFAFVQDSTTSCARAAEEGRQVTVKDVAVAEIFDEDSRRTILRAGSRGCHSVPLTGPGGAVLGMVSSHHERPLLGFTRAQLDELEAVGEQVGLRQPMREPLSIPASFRQSDIARDQTRPERIVSLSPSIGMLRTLAGEHRRSVAGR